MSLDALVSCRLLLADDETAFREPLVRRLRHRGMDVSETVDGKSTLQWFADGNTADVLLLDIQLGDMDGRDVLREVMKQEAPPAVIIVSGHAYTDIALEAMQAGASDYLIKPCPLEDLLERVADAHARRQERLGV